MRDKAGEVFSLLLLVGVVLQQIAGLAVERVAELVEHVDGDVLGGSRTHGRDGRGPDARFFCQLPLIHIVKSDQYACAELNQWRTPPYVSLILYSDFR